jgi:hypothetical protein
MPADEVFNHYMSSRAETLDLLTPLEAVDWWRVGYHGEFGEITLQEHASYFTRHERSHLLQLAQIVRAVSE